MFCRNFSVMIIPGCLKQLLLDKGAERKNGRLKQLHETLFFSGSR